MNILDKQVARIVIGALATSVAFIGMAQTAEATGGTCYSVRQENEIFGPNSYRVRAYCSALNSDSRARGVLDIASEPDVNTGYFTTLNKYYYSDYYRCTFSCNNTRVDISRR